MDPVFQQNVIAEAGASIHDVTLYQYNLLGKDRPAEQLRDFSPLIAEHTRNFVGREDVFAALDGFARAHPCGYFQILADSGLGKTALAAEIARRHDAIAFFASAVENRTAPEQCLNHLCAALIKRFALDYPYLPARSGTDSGFLVELLGKAAALSSGPVWLVIDALDEADSQPNRNPLLLPERLPPRVFVALTCRPETVTLYTAPGMRVLRYRLAADSAEQSHDLDRFLSARIPGIHSAAAARISAAAAGNFLYLTFLLADLDEGLRTPDSADLPSGLDAYYEHLWSGIASGDSAAVEILFAALEPVASAFIGALCGMQVQAVDHALAPWRRVLSRDSLGNWRAVHKSFLDFAARKLDLVPAHRRIAAWFHSADRWTDPYASRHLTEHLQVDPPALYRLVRDPLWSQSQDRQDPTGSAFLRDLERAWQTAGRENALAAARGLPLPRLSEELWSAVRFTALGSILPDFICANMESFLPSDLLSVSAAISLLEFAPDNSQALAAVWRIFSQDAGPSTFDRLFQHVRHLPDEKMRRNGMRNLASHVPPDRMAEVFASTSSFIAHRAEVLADLIGDLPAPWPADAQAAAFEAIAGLPCAHCQGWLRSLAAPRLAPDLRREALAQSLDPVRSLPSALYRAWTLSHIAAAWDPPDPNLIREAFEAAAPIVNPDYQLQARLALVAAVGRQRSILGLELALFRQLAGELECPHCRAVFLTSLSNHTSPVEQPRLDAEVRALIQDIADPAVRNRAASEASRFLGRRIPPQRKPVDPLPPPRMIRTEGIDLQRFKEEAAREKDPDHRAQSFITLALHVDDPEKSDLLRQALAARLIAARKQHAGRRPSKDLARRLRLPRASSEPGFRPIQPYETIQASDLPSKLAVLQQMIDTPYPLPSGFSEIDLLGHNVLPWEFATLASSDLRMSVGNLNSMRLGWIKDLCDAWPTAAAPQRAAIEAKVHEVASLISFPNEAVLARSVIAAALYDTAAAAAVLEDARKIEWPPYRAEALLLLYSLAPRAARADILKAAYRAAFHSHDPWRRAYLEQIAPALTAMPRGELYDLWREAFAYIGPLEVYGESDGPFEGALPALFPMLAALAGEESARSAILGAYDAWRA